jgi:hypothetical protein
MARYLALGMGIALGRMACACLSLFLGCVVVVTVGMVLLNHWFLGALVCCGGNMVSRWLWAWLTRGR